MSSGSPATKLFYYNRIFAAPGVLHGLIPTTLYEPYYHGLKEAIQESIGAAGTVTRVTPRPGEGGALVEVVPTQAKDLEDAAAKGLRRRWLLSSHQARGFPVLGKPFIDENPIRLSRTVELTPKLPDLEIRELLKPYGRILSVSEGKARFLYLQDAITAHYCAQRTQPPEIASDVLRIAYLSPPSLWSRVRAWLSAHSKVVVPAVLAILFGVAYTVFEPVRELSVRTNINGTLASVSKVFAWAQRSGQKLIVWGSRSREDDGSEQLETGSAWSELLKNAQTLKTYIAEGEPTFTVLVGPEGSGKTETLNLALESDELLLQIDCSKLQGSDESMMHNLAQALGYWPMFLWTNKLSKALEFGIKGVTGQTTEITETTDQQTHRMLGTATRAIQKLALRHSPKTMSDSAYLEANPQERPVVVLSGFSGTSQIGSVLAEWAGSLTELNIARVLVVTKDAASFDKVLSNALPNRVFRVVRVEDASPQAAKDYVLRRFSKLADTNEAKLSIERFGRLDPSFLEPLGGRFVDLQSYGRRLLSGESPEGAMASMIHAEALQASQLFLVENEDRWTVEQAWGLMKSLAQGASADSWLIAPGKLSTNPMLASSYNSGALEALESNGIISLHRVGGKIIGIKASRPLVKAAFQELQQDPYVSNMVNAWIAKQAQQKALGEIDSAETELARLAGLPNEREVQDRQRKVAKQLGGAQSKLEQSQAAYEAAANTLKNLEWFDPNYSITNSTTINSWFGSPKGSTTQVVNQEV